MPEGIVSRDAVLPPDSPPSAAGENIDPLDKERSRKELEKLELEIQEQKAWRWKLILRIHL